MIADDEQRIRRGLKNIIPWEEYGMEVVGEAEDGEVALDMAKELKPDVLLLDINMPFLNGLELIEKLEEELFHPYVVIIITGYDDFTYARRALQLRVFEFLLKPVSLEQLKMTIESAKDELMRKHHEKMSKAMSNQLLRSNSQVILREILYKYVHGRMSEEDFKNRCLYYEVEPDVSYTIAMVKVNCKVKVNADPVVWEKELLCFAVQNIMNEIIPEGNRLFNMMDEKGNHIVLMKNYENYIEDIEAVLSSIERYLNHCANEIHETIKDLYELPRFYKEGICALKEAEKTTPVVKLALNYIEKHYVEEGLSLQSLAEELRISTAYLSRLIKEETGKSFIDYVTHLRMSYAMEYMKDPKLKLYEVAERVGYNSQHYFSTVFKKIVGVSPLEYRKRYPL